MKSLYAKVRGDQEWVSCEWVVPEVTFAQFVRLMRQSFEGTKQGDVEMGILIEENALQPCKLRLIHKYAESTC
jgi:hypothetical protein